MLDVKKDISKVPVPIKPVSIDIKSRNEWPGPNWVLWKKKIKVELWEAAFLCFDIDPQKRSYLDIDHHDLHTLEVSVCLELLKSNLFQKEFFSTPYTRAQGEVSNFDLVKLSELATWAINRGYDIPEELTVLVKKPDSDTVTHSVNQDTNLRTNTIQTRNTKNRQFLQECIDNGISPNIESIWNHIIENAGKPNFLFKSASKLTAITTNKHQVRKKNLARRLKRFLNTPKN